MLRQKLEKISQNRIINKAVTFFGGCIYPAVYALAALLSSFFGLEIAYYAVSLAVCIFCTLFCKDSKPILTIFINIIYCVSWKHSPQYGSDYFYNTSVILTIAMFALVAVLCLIFRMAVYGNGKNFFKDSRLRTGILLMCLAFLLNGVFYSGYTSSNLVIGLAMVASFFLAYIFFFHTLEADESTVKYVAYLIFLAGVIVILQLAKVCVADGVIEGGSINKDLIKAGWGMSNNIGGMLAIYMPACFYLALKVKRGGWAFYVSGFVFFGATCLTLSRTSVLVGGVVLACAFVYFCIKKTPFRKFVWIFNGVLVIAAIIAVIAGWSYIKQLFAVYFERGLSDSGRFEIWLSGLKAFVSAPVFGVGFYGAEDFYNIENWVLPDMYHNLFIQMLASCGILGICAIVIHLAQVIMRINRKPSAETIFCIAVPAVILAASLLDNHIFHFFPAFVYSVFIFLIEGDGGKNPLWQGIKRKKADA